MITKFKIAVLGFLLLAFALGFYFFGEKTTQPATENTAPAAAQSQSDGSVILAREPAARTAAQASKPKAVLPKGSRLERQIRVTVKPRASLKIGSSFVATQPACLPVTVDLSLVRDGDGRRVVASSPDGDVVGGIDVPLESGTMPIPRPWAAGVSCNLGQTCALRGTGAWIERDLGRVRVGAEVFRQSDGHAQGRVRAGWVW
jgi:hypothetical protein